ncbi:putative chromatin remodeling & transcriptional activation CHROMO-DOMAIN family [Dioscorea sansibarensis]
MWHIALTFLKMRKEFTRVAEKILDQKVEGQSKKNRNTFYLVKWKGSTYQRQAGKKIQPYGSLRS